MKRVIPILLILMAAVSMSCSRKVYVPVDNSVIKIDTVTKIQRDSIYIEKIIERVDSFYQYDSIIQYVDSAGNVLKEEHHRTILDLKRDKEQNNILKNKLDSVMNSRVDSTNKVVNLDKAIKEPTFSDSIKNVLYYSFIALAILLAILLATHYLLRRKK